MHPFFIAFQCTCPIGKQCTIKLWNDSKQMPTNSSTIFHIQSLHIGHNSARIRSQIDTTLRKTSLALLQYENFQKRHFTISVTTAVAINQLLGNSLMRGLQSSQKLETSGSYYCHHRRRQAVLPKSTGCYKIIHIPVILKY